MVAAPVAGIGNAGWPGSSTTATTPSAVSNMQPVQSPLGASEKILAPHFRQILVTLIITGELRCSLLYCAKFGHILRSNYSDQVTQFVFNIAGSSNSVGNFLA
jgi:hypothetical protein